jgi:hypothetical protein
VQRKKEEELVLKALSYYPKVIELSHICLAALRFQEILDVSLQLQEEGTLLIADIFLEH